ncbi:MAG TPA: GAF domain-containing sensor histidine kinase [Candidatus Eisenbacteria bacterium]|nr:GAF domain-containing sensor histidine kinase [Candidatus Eisenbacteria bacterium]
MRAISGAYLVFSVLALAIGVWGLSVQSRLAILRDRAVDTPLASVRLDGTEAATRGEMQILAQRKAPGSTVALEGDTGRRKVTLQRAYSVPHLVVTTVCGLFFWAVATFVFAFRVQFLEARILYFGTLLYGLAILIGGVYHPASPGAMPLLPQVRMACLLALPALFVTLALVFPRRYAVVDRLPALVPGLFVAAAVLFAWQSGAFIAYIATPSPAAWRAFLVPDRLADIFLIAGDALGCALLYRASRRLELARERRQAKWLLWGITLGVTPYAFLYIAPGLVGLPPLIPLELARLATITIPIAFTFAVAKYRFLDIDIIIRRSIIYALLAGALAAIYAVLVFSLRGWMQRIVPDRPELVPILATAIPLALFHPTRRAIGRWVDRTFFKIQFDFDRALSDYGERLARVASPREIVEEATRVLDRTLAPKRVSVLLGVEAEALAGTLRDRLLEIPESATKAGTPARVIAAPDTTSLPEIERADFPAGLLDQGYRIAAPLVAGGAFLGVVLLSEKQSEFRYIEQEVDFLRHVQEASEQALERIRIVQQMLESQLEAQGLKDLDREKSEFLFRVAHDLRTPLTSIAWSTRNLIDGVAGSVEPRQLEYLSAIDASARQLGRLVQNLLVLSRLDRGEQAPSLEPVSLASAVDEAIVGLKPVAGQRGVRLEPSFAKDLPAARGNREKVIEIVSNLVENAVRFSPPGTAIEVSVESAVPGWQQIVVRDRGPGIGPGDSARLFEQFAQGAPSPFESSQGFGLGLYVVHRYVTMMGGTVEGGNHPEGGARFVCAFPEWPAGGG